MPFTVLALGPRMTDAEGRRHDKGGYFYEPYVLRDPVTRPMSFADKLVANQFYYSFKLLITLAEI